VSANILDSLKDGVAVFMTASRGVRSVYNLIRANPAFLALFEVETVNMSQTFSQRIFKSLTTRKHACLFTLIEKFVTLKTDSYYEVFEICAQDNPSAPDDLLFLAISFSVVQIQERSHVCISVANFSGPLKIIKDRITRQFQTTLTNAIAHERMTPLNAIINGCESLHFKLKPKSTS
jgi:hypothetical protein